MALPSQLKTSVTVTLSSCYHLTITLIGALPNPPPPPVTVMLVLQLHDNDDNLTIPLDSFDRIV